MAAALSRLGSAQAAQRAVADGFKSQIGWQAPTGPLSVIDDHSRYVIRLQQTGSTRGELVQEQLQIGFGENGLPEGMLMDHGIPWWSATTARGATELSVWLMKQGIRLHWSGIRHPQTQGKVERFDGELERALQRRGRQGKPLQQWLDEFRWEHNQVRPHEALQMRTPASVWRPSERPYNPQPARWEYPAGAHVRRLDGDGKLNFQGRNWNIGQALRRQWVQLIGMQDRVLVYYCRTLVRELNSTCKGCVETNRKACLGTRHRTKLVWGTLTTVVPSRV